MATEMDFEQQVFGEFRLIRLLGTGSFGIVFLGENIHDHTLAAVKILKTSMLDTCREQFSKETEILSALDHPNIVSFYKSGTNGSHPFIVMEYVSHGNLRQLYKDPKPPLVNIVSYVQQIASALQHVHDRGIIHGDIRPEHILIGDKNNLLLCDFGMALYTGRTVFTLNGQDGLTRNKAYMAPEQIEGNPIFATDQYALAVMVFELLSEKRPFEGDARYQQRGKSLPRLLTVPPHVEVVLQKALSRDSDQRFKSVKDFADALQTASRQTLPFVSDTHDRPETDDDSSRPPRPPSQSPRGNATPVLSTTRSKQQGVSRRSFLEVASIITMGVTGAFLLGSWVKFGSETVKVPAFPHPSTFAPGDTINVYRGHSHIDKKVDGNVNGLAWSPDGRRIASASFDHTVQVWDALNSDHLLIYTGHIEHVNDVAWSPDGKYIASCSGELDCKDCSVQVWDAFSGRRISLFNGHRAIVNAVAWSPDNKYVASAGFDGTVIVSEARTGKSRFAFQLGHQAFTVAWSPDGQYIAAASDKDLTVNIWQIATQESVATYSGHTGGVLSLTWLPGKSSKYIASGSTDHTVRVWDALTGNDANSYFSRNLNGTVRRVAWSYDGKYIAAGTLNSTVEVWNAQTNQDLLDGGYIYGPAIHINALAWSPDGSKIASGGSDEAVRVWQAL